MHSNCQTDAPLAGRLAGRPVFLRAEDAITNDSNAIFHPEPRPTIVGNAIFRVKYSLPDVGNAIFHPKSFTPRFGKQVSARNPSPRSLEGRLPRETLRPTVWKAGFRVKTFDPRFERYTFTRKPAFQTAGRHLSHEIFLPDVCDAIFRVKPRCQALGWRERQPQRGRCVPANPSFGLAASSSPKLGLARRLARFAQNSPSHSPTCPNAKRPEQKLSRPPSRQQIA